MILPGNSTYVHLASDKYNLRCYLLNIIGPVDFCAAPVAVHSITAVDSNAMHVMCTVLHYHQWLTYSIDTAYHRYHKKPNSAKRKNKDYSK